MIGFFKKLFGAEKAPDYKMLLKQKAWIVDVRSTGEYQSGHIKGSVNIPLSRIPQDLHKFPAKDTPVIVCCASGMRSANALKILRKHGFTQVYNGGGWQSLQYDLTRK